MRAKDRTEYVGLLQSHQLAGGGFDQFFAIQQQIDAMMDRVNPDDESDVEHTVAEIKRLLNSFQWISPAFKALLEGKNHLPDNKLRFSLLNQSNGFMCSGAYREHFFGHKGLPELLSMAVADQVRYSKPALKWQHQRWSRLAGQTVPKG